MLKKTIVALALALSASAATALEWSDSSFKYSYGWDYREPANPEKIKKQIITFTHVDGYAWGGQFLNIDMLISDIKDPAVGGGEGATEVYAVYRNTLSGNKIFKTKAFGPSILRDVALEVGLDINTKNDFFASHKVMPLVGGQLSFETFSFAPGFWNLGVAAVKEWNNNGIVGKEVTFDVTALFSAAWGLDLFHTGIEFEGFANVVLPKGKDGFGADTKTETLIHGVLVYDIAKLWGGKGVKVGPGYEYWNNKFGNDASKDTSGGSKANAYWVEAGIHF